MTDGETVAELAEYMATGRCKTSVARVILRPGEGKLVVNRRAFQSYFPSEALRAEREPDSGRFPGLIPLGEVEDDSNQQ